MSYRILRVVVLLGAAIMPLQVAPVATDAASVPTITAIAAGGSHTCALTSRGGVKCWGYNSSGQLGNGTTTDSLTPVDVSGLSSGATAVTAGDSHTCALVSGGEVKCWGANLAGELGDGSTTDSLIPVDVSRLAGEVIAVAAGDFHTCALTRVGGVKCWGNNLFGQVGDGTKRAGSVEGGQKDSGVPLPMDVSGLASGVTAISGGDAHTCGLTSGGSVMCWGYNLFGQLGNGTVADSLTPVEVSGLSSGATAIAAGDYTTCALTSEGGVKCWGQNGYGGLGNGTTTDSRLPVDVSGLAGGISALTLGSWHSCALTSFGGVKCWGSNNVGRLGNGLTTDSSVPVDVSRLASGVTAIAAGSLHTCALMSGGGVKCWGWNIVGELGDGSTTQSSVPVDVDFASRGSPLTDTADPATHEGRADFPLLPLLAGLGAGIAMLVRPRAREADDRRASTAPGRRSRVDARAMGTDAVDG